MTSPQYVSSPQLRPPKDKATVKSEIVITIKEDTSYKHNKSTNSEALNSLFLSHTHVDRDSHPISRPAALTCKNVTQNPTDIAGKIFMKQKFSPNMSRRTSVSKKRSPESIDESESDLEMAQPEPKRVRKSKSKSRTLIPDTEVSELEEKEEVVVLDNPSEPTTQKEVKSAKSQAASKEALSKLRSIRTRSTKVLEDEVDESRNIPVQSKKSVAPTLTKYASREEATNDQMVRIMVTRTQATPQVSVIEALNRARTIVEPLAHVNWSTGPDVKYGFAEVWVHEDHLTEDILLKLECPSYSLYYMPKDARLWATRIVLSSPIAEAKIKASINEIPDQDLLPVGFYSHEILTRDPQRNQNKSSWTVRLLHVSKHAWCAASFEGKTKAVEFGAAPNNKPYFFQPDLQIPPQVPNTSKLNSPIQTPHVQFFIASQYHYFEKSAWLKWLGENLDIDVTERKLDIALVPALSNESKFASAVVSCTSEEQEEWLHGDVRVTWNNLGKNRINHSISELIMTQTANRYSQPNYLKIGIRTNTPQKSPPLRLTPSFSQSNSSPDKWRPSARDSSLRTDDLIKKSPKSVKRSTTFSLWLNHLLNLYSNAARAANFRPNLINAPITVTTKAPNFFVLPQARNAVKCNVYDYTDSKLHKSPSHTHKTKPKTSTQQPNRLGGGKPNKSQSRITSFFNKNEEVQTDISVIITDSLAYKHPSIVSKIVKWLPIQFPGNSFNIKHSKIKTQFDDFNCGPITINNIINLSKHKTERSILRASNTTVSNHKLTDIRKQVHDRAALIEIGAYTTMPNSNIKNPVVNQGEARSALGTNWLTDNLINAHLSFISPPPNATILSTYHFDTFIGKNRIMGPKCIGRITIMPVNIDNCHWITVSILKNSGNKQNNAEKPPSSEDTAAVQLPGSQKNSPSPKATSSVQYLATPAPSHYDNLMTIISHNINGKFASATNSLDIDTMYKRPDIVCWQETHTSDDNINNLINDHIKDEYAIIFRNLSETEKLEKAIKNKVSKTPNSEGLATFIKKKLMPNTKIVDISRRTIAIAIQTAVKATLLLINVYAPAVKLENKSFWENFPKYISECKAKCHGKITLIIAGDLNTTTLKWHSTSRKDLFINGMDHNLLQIMDKHNLTNHITDPTHHTFSRIINTEDKHYIYEATLDHILIPSTAIPHIVKAKVITNTSIKSDHLPTKLTIKKHVEKRSVKVTAPLDLPRLNIPKDKELCNLKEILKDIAISRSQSFTEISKSIYSKIKSKLGTKSTTKVKSKIKDEILDILRKAKNFTNKIIHKNAKEVNKQKLNRALTRFTSFIAKEVQPRFPSIATPTKDNLDTVRKQLSTAQKSRTKTALTEIIKRKIEIRNENLTKNPKAFFRNILTKNIKGKKDWLTDADGSSYTDVDNKLRIHTNFWRDIYNHPTCPPISINKWFTRCTTQTMNFTYPTNIEEFTEALGPSYKAPGHSNVPFEAIKALPIDAKKVLVDKINVVLTKGIIPNEWRTAKINLLAKDLTSSNLPNTYRPISLLDTSYKTLSAIIHSRLSKHIRDNWIIHKSQSGYMKGQSTANNIITLNNILEDAKQFNKQIHLLPIDLVKAYDKVQHWAIEAALINAGVDTKTTNLIMDMHRNTKAYINIEGHKGTSFDIRTGVRQGDVLAPLLFLLVINPLLEAIDREGVGYRIKNTNTRISVLAYCDDIIIITKSRSSMEKLAELLSSYLEDFSMEVNAAKSVYTSNVPLSNFVHVGKKIIKHTEQSSHFKYLGIWFSVDLNWSKSLNIALNTAKSRLAILTSKKISIETKAMVINTVILKAVEYTLNFAHFSPTQIKELNTAIIKCIKYSIPMNSRTPSDFVWRAKEEGGFEITETSSLMNTATLRTTFNTILADKRSLAYKTTVGRMLSHQSPEFVNNRAFSTSEDRPIPDRKTNDAYVDRIINSALDSGLTIHNNFLVRDNCLSISKMSDPYPLIPLDFIPENFTILNDNSLAVWTDGSHRNVKGKPKTAWGVAFAPDSSHNTWRRTNLSYNNLLAELEAIEFALSKAPTSHNVTIFTDSLSSIKILNSDPPRVSTPERDYYDRINKLIKERAEYHSLTSLQHIYSHIDKKLASNDADLVHRVRTQIYELEVKYGHSSPLYQGNELADELAHKATKTEMSYIPFPTSSKDFFVSKIKQDRFPAPLYDIGAHNKRRQHLIWTSNKVKREKFNGEDLTLSQNAVQSRSDTHRTLKLQSFALATRAQCHANHIYSSKTGRNHNKLNKLYDKPTCIFCDLQVPETTIHLIGECPKWEHLRNNLKTELDLKLSEIGATTDEDMTLRSYHNYAETRSSKFNKYRWSLKSKLLASVGRLNHEELTKEWAHLDKTTLKNTFMDITNIILDHQTAIIKTRNKLFQEWSATQ